jgi:hypothetical protein
MAGSDPRARSWRNSMDTIQMKKHIFLLTQTILEMASYEELLEDRLAEKERYIIKLQKIISKISTKQILKDAYKRTEELALNAFWLIKW